MKSEVEEEKQANPNESADSWKEGLKYLIIPAIAVFLLLRVVFTIYIVPSGSMEPQIPAKSINIGWRLPYLFGDPELDRGDIIVFKIDGNERFLLKRVIAVEGDTVQISNGKVFLNGKELNEPYVKEPMITNEEQLFVVPEGCIFCLGDNRNHSNDARVWDDPYVKLSSVYAKILFRNSALTITE